jgi:hypothetical protein
MSARVSQEVVEAEIVGTPSARVSQIVVEAEVQGAPDARVSQQVLEAEITGEPDARASQLALEPLIVGLRQARISQLVIECLVPNVELLVPIVFPTLPGLGYSTHWKPNFFNAKTATSSSGADIDLSLADTPLHDFELTFNFLRDRAGWQGGGLAKSIEWRTLAGFVLQMQGTVGRCLFKWKDDCAVRSQSLGTTDGITRIWTLQRMLGAGGYGGMEPIGWLDQTEPFNLYLDGVWQDPSSYALLTSVGCQQQVDFNAAPAAGQEITCDMSYFYYCKLSENAQDFEKFMNHLWKVGKLTLHSCRPGA